jgi:putative PIN family toxin of toxin-antitoxin system
LRIVLDTNVFISGIFFGGPPGDILQAWREGKIQIILSPEIFREYEDVGNELAFRYPGVDISSFLNLMKINAIWIKSAQGEIPICDDPADVKFILCALEGHVDFIISGDKHLLRLNGYKDLSVLRPSAFVNQHLKQKK